jgi:hypothetical protein
MEHMMNEQMRTMVEAGTLSEEAYKQLVETLGSGIGQLYEVKYTATTVTANHMDPGEQSYIDKHNQLMVTHTQHTKIMQGGGEYSSADFEQGKLCKHGSGLAALYKPGTQLVKTEWPNSTDGFEHSHQSMVVLYTIIDIKPFSNKRARSESVADDSEEEG